MKRNVPRSVLMAGALASLLLASSSYAQEAGPAPPPDRDAPGGGHGPPPAESPAELSQHLRDILQLRTDQQGALDAFVAAMQPPMDVKEKVMRDMREDRALPTPQRLDHMLAHFDEMRATMAARAAATKRFYAQLSAPQQKAFDALGPHLARLMMGMDPGETHHHEGGEGRHGMGHKGEGPAPPPP
jgi:hypothetical protein